MSKLITFLFVSAMALFATASFADATWSGKLYDITPTHEGVTADFCKAHVLDTYQTSPAMVDKEVTASNGVKAKDLGFRNQKVGNVYMQEGRAMFSGTTDGKEWKEKANFYAYGLEKDGKMQGVWYTKDCKGFYEVGP